MCALVQPPLMSVAWHSITLFICIYYYLYYFIILLPAPAVYPSLRWNSQASYLSSKYRHMLLHLADVIFWCKYYGHCLADKESQK